MEKFYTTTAIDYVNGAPHIGHAYEKILTDVIYRHFTQRCDNTYFLTGTDEHGIKIQKTSAQNGVSPKEFCDMNAQKFKDAWKALDVEYSQFIRTTDEQHEKVVQKIFKKLVEKGDIYKHAYEGLYCSGCEAFLSEKDLTEDGLCPDHLKKPEVVKEENYFFKLTKYKDAIIKHIKTHPDFIVPSFRANEVLNQLENIEDISVSRVNSNVSWGIPVLGDDSQVIYVWIDALSNAHGWITIDQTKMSKSLGNVISPTGVLEAFNLEIPDPLRYYMAVAAPCGKDGNYSDEDFKEKVNAHLANSMGNLLNRTLSMLVKYFGGDIKPEFLGKNELKEKALETVKAVKHHFDYFEIQEAGQKIIELVDITNKYVTDNAPWTLAKEGQMDKCGEVLTNVLQVMTVISSLIYPYCPNIAKAMAEQLSYDLNTKLDDITCESLQAGHLIDKENIKPVFLRMDSELADKDNKK